MLKCSEIIHKNSDSFDILKPYQDNSSGLNYIHESTEDNIFDLIFSMKKKQLNQNAIFHQTKSCVDTFQNVEKATGNLLEKNFLEVKKKLRLLRLNIGRRHKIISSSSIKSSKWKKKHSKN